VAGDDDRILRREVTGADGVGYKVIVEAKDWNLGTGSVLLDAAQFVWASVRRARGKEWMVSVRAAEAGSSQMVTRRTSTRETALAIMEELIESIEAGRDLDGEHRTGTAT